MVMYSLYINDITSKSFYIVINSIIDSRFNNIVNNIIYDIINVNK